MCEVASEAEVADLQVVVNVQEEILAFEIPVYDVVAFQVLKLLVSKPTQLDYYAHTNAFDQLPKQEAGLQLVETLFALDPLQKIAMLGVLLDHAQVRVGFQYLKPPFMVHKLPRDMPRRHVSRWGGSVCVPVRPRGAKTSGRTRF